ncbi:MULTISPECIES: helicase associated domain-containing protein [Kitasatospora]|uniref:Helicase-associated domain-containing protein n=1 Tax=Kitasatospora cystarginea TaxID=58350 RepID=A0ABP5RW52_9ACTN
MIWSKNAGAWERGHAYAKAFYQQHGHLAIPATAKLDDYAAGRRMRRQREAENLTNDQAAKLDALDELWRMDPNWSRPYRECWSPISLRLSLSQASLSDLLVSDNVI